MATMRLSARRLLQVTPQDEHRHALLAALLLLAPRGEQSVTGHLVIPPASASQPVPCRTGRCLVKDRVWQLMQIGPGYLRTGSCLHLHSRPEHVPCRTGEAA